MEENQKPIDKNRWSALLIVVLVVFMATLDSSIVNIALPTMAQNLNVTSGAIAWVVSSYLVVISATILIFGRLGDIKGKTNVFRIGLAVFTFGSMLCALANTFGFLVAARIVQAIGAGGTMANSQGIITHLFPSHERGRALGISGTFVALGTLAGPSLGGFILALAGWPPIFWINVPVGVLIFLLSFKLLPAGQKSGEKLDLRGALLFIAVVVPLFCALGEGQAIGFGDPKIAIAFVVSLTALIAFLRIEKKLEAPLLDLTIFKNKWFSVSIACAFVSFVAMFCSTIVQPFYLQNVLQYSPTTAGLFMTIYPLTLALVSPASGYFSDKIGSELLTFIGLLLTCVGLFLMSTLDEHPSLWAMGLFIVVMSLGNGLFQSPNNSLVMSTLPKHKLGIGGSVNALVRNLGMVCGISLATTLLYSSMSTKIGYHVTGYIEGRNDAFIYGMRIVYITAAAICSLGALITALRLYGRRLERKKTAKEKKSAA